MKKDMAKLISPRAEEYRERPRAARGRVLTDLHGKLIAFVDNGRPNADIALAGVREEMERAFHIRPVSVEYKAYGLSAGGLFPKEVFDRLVNEADAVVWGIGS
ncbi:MAG: hypothetical protein HYX92_04695 [Chloroflexi bacterium]|nr:hypothetical protein [Chloroflexota bacterium]